MALRTELLKYGLSQKEADVYLALMELGYATVQQIAQKSAVNRATTYIIVDSLIDKGLVSTFEKEKKTFYAAENPENLMNYLAAQEREYKEKRNELQRVLPDLLGIFNLAQNKPAVKYYEGKEAFQTMYKEFFRADKDKLVRSFYPYSLFYSVKDNQEIKSAILNNHKSLTDKGFQFRWIISMDDALRDDFERTQKQFFKFVEYCILSESEIPLNSEIAMIENKMVIYRGIKGKDGDSVIDSGVMLNDSIIVKNFVSIFDLLWNSCQKK